MRPTCSIDKCGRPSTARGWCPRHYSRWRITGDPLGKGRLYRAPLADRLASKLALTDDGCLVFLGWTDPHGYGRFKVSGAMRKPHRVAYELWVGPIPDGLQVCHRCDNPSCCLPEHLFTGTHADNMRDMASKGRGDFSGLRAPVPGAQLSARARRLRAEAAVAAGHPNTWKRCARCDQFKAPDAFGSNASRPDGLQVYCRPCFSDYREKRTQQWARR